MNILNDLHEMLNRHNLLTTLLPPTPEFSQERLVIAFDKDILEITVHPEFMEGVFTKENVKDSYHLVQFQIVLLVDISPETFNQLSTSLHFFNRLILCPGFELDELNDRVVYRYNWFVKKNGIDSFLLMQVVQNMQLCFSLFSPYITGIAKGEYTLEDILEKVVELNPQKMT